MRQDRWVLRLKLVNAGNRCPVDPGIFVATGHGSRLPRLTFPAVADKSVPIVDWPDTTTYRLIDGEPLQVLHDGEPVTVSTVGPALRPTRKKPAAL